MHLFSSVKKHSLEFKPLALCPQYAEIVATWFTDEWGYLYDPKNMTRSESIGLRKTRMSLSGNRIYLALLGGHPVGGFRLEPKPYCEELQNKVPNTTDIYWVYVEKDYRNLGIGRQLIEKIREVAKHDLRSELLVLEILKPHLAELVVKKTVNPDINRKYEGIAQAKKLVSNHLEGEPTDVLTMDLKEVACDFKVFETLEKEARRLLKELSAFQSFEENTTALQKLDEIFQHVTLTHAQFSQNHSESGLKQLLDELAKLHDFVVRQESLLSQESCDISAASHFHP